MARGRGRVCGRGIALRILQIGSSIGARVTPNSSNGSIGNNNGTVSVPNETVHSSGNGTVPSSGNGGNSAGTIITPTNVMQNSTAGTSLSNGTLVVTEIVENTTSGPVSRVARRLELTDSGAPPLSPWVNLFAQNRVQIMV